MELNFFKGVVCKADMAESHAIRDVQDFCKEIEEEFEEMGASYMIAIETGEKISVEDLQRVRGILSGLLDNSVWDTDASVEN